MHFLYFSQLPAEDEVKPLSWKCFTILTILNHTLCDAHRLLGAGLGVEGRLLAGDSDGEAAAAAAAAAALPLALRLREGLPAGDSWGDSTVGFVIRPLVILDPSAGGVSWAVAREDRLGILKDSIRNL